MLKMLEDALLEDLADLETMYSTSVTCRNLYRGIGLDNTSELNNEPPMPQTEKQKTTTVVVGVALNWTILP